MSHRYMQDRISQIVSAVISCTLASKEVSLHLIPGDGAQQAAAEGRPGQGCCWLAVCPDQRALGSGTGPPEQSAGPIPAAPPVAARPAVLREKLAGPPCLLALHPARPIIVQPAVTTTQDNLLGGSGGVLKAVWEGSGGGGGGGVRLVHQLHCLQTWQFQTRLPPFQSCSCSCIGIVVCEVVLPTSKNYGRL